MKRILYHSEDLSRLKRALYLFSIVLIIIFTACTKDDPEPEPEPPYVKINNFIWDAMSEVYLWENYLPQNLDVEDYPDSKEYFDELIYKQEDFWSYITDDYQAFGRSLEGIAKSMGHIFQLYRYSEGDGIFGIVLYVLPGSPAKNAGLKRGDIFTAINSTELDIDNYKRLIDLESFDLSLATRDGGVITPSGETVSLTAVELQEDPIFIHKVIEQEGKKIGYLMYNQFIAKFNDDITDVFEQFKSENVTEFILDLRYNPGGMVTAMDHLGNFLPPLAVTSRQEIFYKDRYNAGYEAYFRQNFSSDYLNTRFEEVSGNLNLSSLYVLATGRSASASEALVNGLMLYSDVTLLGDTTHGKYTGAWVIPEYLSDSTINENDDQWAIAPIVSQNENANGEINHKGGLTPDFEVVDNPFDGKLLGDPSETMLAAALSKITGSEVAMSLKSARIPIGINVGVFRNGKPLKPIPMTRKPDIYDFASLKSPSDR